MSNASTAAKQRWNKKHYSEVKASLKKELVEEFKAKCKENGVSIASVLAMQMSEYCGKTIKQKERKKTLPYDTLPKRRKLVAAIADQLDDILQYEIAYRENMAPNFQNSMRAESADHRIETLEETLDAIREAYQL